MDITFEKIVIDEIAHDPIEIGSVGNGKELIIFVPGVNVNIRDLNDVMLPLAEKYTVVSFRFPNKEIVNSGKKIPIENYFIIMDFLIDKFKLSPKAVIGQSFGGGIALSYSSVRPEIKRVVAISPVTGKVFQSKITLLISIFRNIWQRSQQEKNLGVLSNYKTIFMHLGQMLKMYSTANEFEFHKYLNDVKCKTLFFVGGTDIIVSPDEQIKTAKAIPNSKLVFYKDLGHSLLHVNTTDVVKNIFEFLGD